GDLPPPAALHRNRAHDSAAQEAAVANAASADLEVHAQFHDAPLHARPAPLLAAVHPVGQRLAAPGLLHRERPARQTPAPRILPHHRDIEVPECGRGRPEGFRRRRIHRDGGPDSEPGATRECQRHTRCDDPAPHGFPPARQAHDRVPTCARQRAHPHNQTFHTARPERRPERRSSLIRGQDGRILRLAAPRPREPGRGMAPAGSRDRTARGVRKPSRRGRRAPPPTNFSAPMTTPAGTEITFRVRPYRAPRWLRGPHIQTIGGKFLRPDPGIPLRRERLELPDGDFLDLDFAPAGSVAHDPEAPVVLVLHGLEGSARRRYMLLTYRELLARGLRPVGLNFRACSGEPNRLPRLYHSGDTDDLRFVVEHLADRFNGAPL